MNNRAKLARNELNKERDALDTEMSANRVARHNQPYQVDGTGDRIASVDSTHLKELKIKAATAAHASLRELGTPIHNARVGNVVIAEQDEVMGKVIVKKAAFIVKFDVPYSNASGKGVRTASIPVSYSDASVLVGNEIEFNDVKMPATVASLNQIAATKDTPKAESDHTIVAIFDKDHHEIIGATESAPSLVAALKTAGFRVAFRNPQDAVGIEVNEPFYEVLVSNDVEGAKKVASLWMKQNKKVAQLDPLDIPAATAPTNAPQELEVIKKDLSDFVKKEAELTAMYDAYAEGLAKKEGFASRAAMMQRGAEIKKQLHTTADMTKAALLRFQDGTLMAKVSSLRRNDPQWTKLFAALSGVSKVAKSAVNAVTRYAQLFQTNTLTHRWQDISPDDIGSVYDKQSATRDRLTELNKEQDTMKSNAPVGLLNSAGGSMPVKMGQAATDPFALPEMAVQDLAERADLIGTLTNDIISQIDEAAETTQLNQEYPLPTPTAAPKTASKRATNPIKAQGTYDKKLTDAELNTVKNFQFSSAKEGKHWAFYRTCSKNAKGAEQTGILGKYVAMGFSKDEAFAELKRKAQMSEAKFAEVFPAKSEQAAANVEAPDRKLVKASDFVLGDVEDLQVLPGEAGKPVTAVVHFYLGGRLYSERMAVLQSGGKYFIDFVANEEKLF